MSAFNDAGSMLGSTTRIIGDVHGKEDFVLSGQVQGTLHFPESVVTVAPTGHVVGTVAAREVVIQGRVDGDIHADGLVDVRRNGVLMGDVFASRIAIEHDATFQGRVDPTRPGAKLPAASPSPAQHVPVESPQIAPPAAMPFAQHDAGSIIVHPAAPVEQARPAPLYAESIPQPLREGLFTAHDEAQGHAPLAEETLEFPRSFAGMPAGLAAAMRHVNEATGAAPATNGSQPEAPHALYK